MSDNDNDDLKSKVAVLLIGVGSAAVVVTIYHFLAMTWCCRRYRAGHNHPRQYSQPHVNDGTTGNSIESCRAQVLIPAHKYQKGMGLIGDDGTCAICLSEFEGEELRTLPECLHSYHMACIDMWLCSHSNCPMCRTDATPSPQVFLNATVLDSGRSPEVYRNVGVLQGVVVHSRAI